MNKLIPILFAVVLLGASCAPAEKVTNDVPNAPKSAPAAGKLEDVKMPDEKKTEVATPKSEGVRELTPAVTDETWKQYTSKALGFTFMWPTKGRYAPEWEVKLLKAEDFDANGILAINPFQDQYPDLQFRGIDQEQVRVAEQVFLHGSSAAFLPSATEPQSIEEAKTTNDQVLLDTFLTKIGQQSVIILFSKKPVPTNDDYLKYKQALDGIVGTFKLKAE